MLTSCTVADLIAHLLGNTKRYLSVRALHVHERFHVDHHDNDLALLELTHPLNFSPAHIHLCLPSKDFCENILMHPGKTGVIKTPGVSQTQELVYMTLDECRSQLKVSHLLSNKMFCMKQNGAAGRQNGPSGNRNGAREATNVRAENQNQTQNGQNGVHGKPNGAEKTSKIQNHESSAAESSPMSETKQCDHLLPGTPVATVDRGTVFLTGLLTSSPADCSSGGGGLVFTKVSRHLGWIKPRLEATKGHMTPQVMHYPENR